MADDLHLHIRDHVNDCIRCVLGAVADDLRDRARALREGHIVMIPGPIEALEVAAQDVENMAEQFK